MKSQFLILAVVAALASCRPGVSTVWTKEYEAKTYHDIDVSLAPSIQNAGQRKLLIDFTMQRLKKQLPSGLESIPADSLHRLCFKIGEDTLTIRDYIPHYHGQPLTKNC